MQKVRISLVVIGKTISEFLNNLEQAQKKSNLVEARVDYIKNFSSELLEEIYKKKKKDVEIILTCRNRENGGEFEEDTDKQNEILQKANDLGFEYLDIDYSLIEQIEIKNKTSKIICSYHNFEFTPPFEELSDLIDKMRRFKQVDICKVATMVKTKKDNDTIYNLIKTKKNLGEVIILGMGEIGREIRVKGLIEGNYLTFASIGDNSSAPGQLSISQIKQELEIFMKNNKFVAK